MTGLSCTSNKDEPVVPQNDGKNGSNQEIQVTYTSHVKNIIDNNCVSCHSSGGTGQPPFLTNYNEVFTKRVRIDDRAIKNIPSAMPPGNPLTQDLKDTLQLWINQGALQ